MRLNFFSHKPAEPVDAGSTESARADAGRKFPADEVVWGIAIRNGFDELDDPWYHRGTTQHAYLEGSDEVALCGFRPPQSGPRNRRRPRLGMPDDRENPMCGMCARMIVAPRPRVPVPVQPARAPVAVPVARPADVGVSAAAASPQRPVAPPPQPAVPAPVSPAPPAQGLANSPAAPQPASTQPAIIAQGPAIPPWIRRARHLPDNEAPAPPDMTARHDGGLIARGVHTEPTD
jgi:hypothetical protein